MSLNLETADLYHAQRLTKEAWESIPEERRQRALTASIDLLGSLNNNFGSFYATAAVLAYEQAVFEQALYMTTNEYSNTVNGISNIRLGDLAISYFQPDKVPAGYSSAAWRLLAKAGVLVPTNSLWFRGGKIL